MTFIVKTQKRGPCIQTRQKMGLLPKVFVIKLTDSGSAVAVARAP